MGKNRKKNFFATTLIIGIKTYQVVLSPVLGQCCRFYPSCSNYFIEAIQRYGIFKATLLFLKRILKCHPFHPGGYDPLPCENKK